ncbi:hypothetical protein VE01_09108 [Pseudogymnoascus verrucosus]|uniref:Uncharacterized protein n=1 Tax=Pseudogymnoascus verrucosus TaxID=342668 RepID=A0A1B8GAH6_9PEZI|nr:uncharacterized protein VE01_09108 [Pseudogymnoascus verrucosus]OBT92830.1 hypothetical protein VE01_09108 [Pseudogymnoascus verrucosus]
MDHGNETHQMLGCHPSEFIKFVIEERPKILWRHLVKEDGYIDDDDNYNKEFAEGVLLRRERFMGDDESGKQIVKEAREIYYGENTFSVESHCLRVFLIRDTRADGKPMAVEPFVSGLLLCADSRHIKHG